VSQPPTHTLIVGAGLAGALMACYLARRGHHVSIYERRPDPRAKGFIGGRSINLALSARGLAGLAGVGLDQQVLARAIRMPGRMIHPASPGAATVFQPYSANPADAINSISRSDLNLTLINAAAAHEHVLFQFDHPCLDIDLAATAATFQTPSGPRRVEADLIIGADGAFSAVRGAMQKIDRFDYSQSYLEHGYKELHIPPRDGGFAMDPHALHIWPRGGSMMIALPNPDRSFTCTLFWPFEAFDALRTPAEVEHHFRGHYSDAVPLMPTLAEDYARNPTGSLITIRCRPWAVGRTVLLGDAAHAIVPFFGQGMNAAFEDCLTLDRCLGEHPEDLGAALHHFQQIRKPNADAIADMALENFVEMRDRVGRPDFLYRKKVEQAIHESFPGRVTPLYNLVSFSTVPYAEALARGRALDRTLDRVIASLPREQAATLPPEQWKERVRALAAPALAGES
jgi:kynurenine 3-monooxygenase